MLLYLKKNPIIIFLILSIPIFLRPSIHGNDGILNYIYLRSIAVDFDIDFLNDYKIYDEITDGKYKLSQKPISDDTGKIENRYGIGSAIMWAPFWLIARIIDKTFNLTSNIKYDGCGRIYEIFISIGSCIYGLIGVYLLFLLLEKFWNRTTAYLSILIILCASPLFFYAYLHPSMSHANAFFLSSAVWFTAIMYNKNFTLKLAFIGSMTGLLAITRFQDILFVMPIPFLLFIRAKNTKEEIIDIVFGYLFYAVLFFISLMPQLLVWKNLYGSYFSGPAPYLQYPEFKLYYPIHFLQVLFSSRHGLLYWHPLLAFGIMGLFLKEDRNKPIKTALLIGFALEYYLLSCWSEWHAGASFGHRLFITTFPAVGFGLAIFINRFQKISYKILYCVVLLFVIWNFGLIYQYGKGMIPREDYVSLGTIIKNQFIEIPKEVLKKF